MILLRYRCRLTAACRDNCFYPALIRFHYDYYRFKAARRSGYVSSSLRELRVFSSYFHLVRDTRRRIYIYILNNPPPVPLLPAPAVVHRLRRRFLNASRIVTSISKSRYYAIMQRYVASARQVGHVSYINERNPVHKL